MGEGIGIAVMCVAMVAAFAIALSADLNRLSARAACEHGGSKCVEMWVPVEPAQTPRTP